MSPNLTEQGSDYWRSRAIPILEAVAQAEDAGAKRLDLRSLSSELGLTTEQLSSELARLENAGFLGGEVKRQRSGGGELAAIVYPNPWLTERGQREIGRWPSSANEGSALLSVAEVRAVEKVVGDLQRALDAGELQLDDEERHEFEIDLRAAADQLRSTRPKRSIVKAALGSIIPVLQSAVGSGLVLGVQELFKHL